MIRQLPWVIIRNLTPKGRYSTNQSVFLQWIPLPNLHFQSPNSSPATAISQDPSMSDGESVPMNHADQSSSFSVRQFRRIALYSIVVCVVIIVCATIVPKLLFAQEESTWRYTKYGWQDSATWVRQQDVPFERRVELIHPLALTGVILLSVGGMLLWAAEEWEVAHLLEGESSICRRAKPRGPTIHDYLEAPGNSPADSTNVSAS